MSGVPPIWVAVDRLIERAPTLADLRAHRLHLLAGAHWRSAGRPLPEELDHELRHAQLMSLLVPAVLEKVRNALEGPILILKGPEVAARYRQPAARGFIDLDLLVPDVIGSQQRLLEAGFKEVADPPWAFRRTRAERENLFDRMHHARPLLHPELPLKLELHRWPGWPRWLRPPDPDDLVAGAVPTALGVEGVSTPRPAHHALVIAAHSWVHTPVGRARDLIDVVLMAGEAEAADIEETAARWQAAPLWRSTFAAAEALLGRRSPTLAQRTWARNLLRARERTVLENHLENWLSPFSTLPPGKAFRQAIANLVWDFRPAANEGWLVKLGRMARATTSAGRRKSEHDVRLGAEGKQFHAPNRWDRPPGPGEDS